MTQNYAILPLMLFIGTITVTAVRLNRLTVHSAGATAQPVMYDGARPCVVSRTENHLYDVCGGVFLLEGLY